MLSQAQRTTILELNTQGVSKREIARVLGISRVAVRKVLRSNSTTLPELRRPEKAEPHRQQIQLPADGSRRNVILFIGDAMGTAYRDAARLVSRAIVDSS